ncbi:MAG: hypothetical protein QXJ58_06910 [Archaeoglobaceae archaeon]
MSPKVLLIGLGGYGGRLISKISEMKTQEKTFVLDSDRNCLEMTKAKRKILIEDPVISIKRDHVLQILSGTSRDFFASLEEYDLIFLCCGLGGRTGTVATTLIANIARNFATVVCLAVIPFAVERKRYNMALQFLEILRKMCDTLILMENDWLFRNCPPNMPTREALKVPEGIIATTITAMANAITSPIAEFDADSFLKLLSSGGTSTMLFGEGKSCFEALESCLSRPLFNVDISSANSLFLHFETGKKSEAESAVYSLKPDFNVFLSFCENEGERVFGVAFGIEPEIERYWR